MTAPYDLSFVNSTNAPVSVLVGINSALGGVLGVGISLVIYFILIKESTDRGYGIGTALLTTSFIMSIISGILLSLQLLPDYVLGVNMAVFVAAIFINVFGDK